MKYKITLKTEEDGETEANINYSDVVTWIELTKTFSSLLKTLGFCPRKLDDFLENLELEDDQ